MLHQNPVWGVRRSAAPALRLSQHRFGQIRIERAEAQAEPIIREELRRSGWPEKPVAMRRKCDPEKLEIAVRLRREMQ